MAEPVPGGAFPCRNEQEAGDSREGACNPEPAAGHRAKEEKRLLS